jgi:phage tail protein X
VHGDTLYSIAQRYYGVRSRAKVMGIVDANRGVLSGPSSPLRIGMTLRIP